jgi:pimeloyl-ACP methyl ester carboxylesterase
MKSMSSTQSSINHHKIKADDIVVSYFDEGKSSVPIVFIHGFPFDKTSWNNQIEFFSKSFRVIAYDIRGFGQSTAGDQEASIDLFANDLIHLLDVLKIEKAIVCGLSMGGYIVLNAVNRFPQRFVAIILANTQCLADSSETKVKRFDTINKLKQNGKVAFAEGFINQAFFEETIVEQKKMVQHAKQVILETSTNSIISGLKALAGRSENCSILQNIQVPSLIISGKHDQIIDPIESEYLNTSISKSSIGLIDKAAHLSNLDQPLAFNHQIFNFLKDKVAIKKLS